jgi:predicted N-acetyltransferase YhbS
MHRNIIIRREMPEDHPAVRRVNEQAFGRPQEADSAPLSLKGKAGP